MDRDDHQKPKPSCDVFYEKKGKDGETFLKRFDAAFAHKDGKGHTFDPDVFPRRGPIILREPQERLEEKRNGDDRRDSRDGRRERDER